MSAELEQRVAALERVVAELIGWPTGVRTPIKATQWARIGSALSPDAAIREKAEQLDDR